MKHSYWLLLASVVCMAMPVHVYGGYADEVLADNPVAYFRMDEPSDSVLPVDATGNVLTQSIGYDDRGGMAWGEAGIPGTVDEGGNSVLFQSDSFSFACNGFCGAGSVYLGGDFQDGPLDLGTIDDGTPITLEAWFTLLPGWEASSYPRLFHYNNGPEGQYTFGIVGNDVPAAFPAARTVWGGRGDGGGGSVILAAESDTLPSGDDTAEGEWFHLVAHSQEDEIRLWLNGVELTELEDSDPIGWQATQATIGARIQSDETTVVQSFPGTIDELAIYSTLLPEDRIIAHYQAGLGILADPTIDDVQEAIRSGENPAALDFNNDGVVDLADQDIFVNETLNTYIGDSNLDGEFSSTDLVSVFVTGEYEDNTPDDASTILNSTWADGDWDANGEFESADFVAAFTGGGYELGPRAATAAVPEPAVATLLASALLVCLFRRK